MAKLAITRELVGKFVCSAYVIHQKIISYSQILTLTLAFSPLKSTISTSAFKGAVSYRFSQGLLTLMCNNSKLKADINFFFFFCCVGKHPKSITGCKNLWFNTWWLCYSVWGKTHVFHNSGFNSETILPISIFLLMIMIHTCFLPKTVSAFANSSFIFGNIPYIL